MEEKHPSLRAQVNDVWLAVLQEPPSWAYLPATDLFGPVLWDTKHSQGLAHTPQGDKWLVGFVALNPDTKKHDFNPSAGPFDLFEEAVICLIGSVANLCATATMSSW